MRVLGKKRPPTSFASISISYLTMALKCVSWREKWHSKGWAGQKPWVIDIPSWGRENPVDNLPWISKFGHISAKVLSLQNWTWEWGGQPIHFANSSYIGRNKNIITMKDPSLCSKSASKSVIHRRLTDGKSDDFWNPNVLYCHLATRPPRRPKIWGHLPEDVCLAGWASLGLQNQRKQ